MEQVRNNICYDYIEDDKIEMVDSVLASIEEVFASQSGTIRIGGNDMVKSVVVSNFLKLNQFHIEHIIEKIEGVTNPIVHQSAYIKTCLYRAIQEMPTSDTNFFNYNRLKAAERKLL